MYCRVLPGNTALDDEFTAPGLVQSERAVQFLGLLLFWTPVVDGRESVAGAGDQVEDLVELRCRIYVAFAEGVIGVAVDEAATEAVVNEPRGGYPGKIFDGQFVTRQRVDCHDKIVRFAMNQERFGNDFDGHGIVYVSALLAYIGCSTRATYL